MFQSKLANFGLQIFLYNKMLMIRRNFTVEGISPCVFATASILFSNYYALLYNVYYLQYLFLENITDDAHRKSTIYTFQLKSPEHDNVILFQVFLRIIEWGGPNESVSGGGVGGRLLVTKE